MIQRKSNIINGQASFNRLALVTLIAVYFLILVGGIVRSTGSGMGCPDWPKCFDQWVPPTSAQELPEGYEEGYAARRLEKNIRLAKYLVLLGMEGKADQVVEDELIQEEQEFNVYKTWTEYINRLIGAIIGLLVLATCFVSLRRFGFMSKQFWVSLVVVILTIFTGWIGSLVVSTNLLPWMVTFHMIISYFIVAGLIYLVFTTRNEDKVYRVSRPSLVYSLIALGTIALVIQVIYGTQVRETVDSIALSLEYTLRDTWVSQLDWQFYFHRSFSWLVLIINGILCYLLMKNGYQKWGFLLIGAILLAVGTGALMAYFAIPPVLQPVHLLLGVIIFGIQCYIFLLVRNGLKYKGVKES